MIEQHFPDYDELESTIEATAGATAECHNETYGEPLVEQPDDNTTRIYIQNINGLCWDSSGGKWPYLCEVMASLQVDVACFSEINTDTNQYTVRRKMETICHQQFSQSQLILATSKYTTSSTYKPGGAAIMACGSITSCIKSHNRDRMGRWTSMLLQTSPKRKIRVISAYQVCQATSVGAITTSAQQQAQILEESALTAST